MKMTKHATKRLQQRGIMRESVDHILAFGTPTALPGNALGFFLKRKVAADIITQLKKRMRQIERSAGKIIVVDKDDDSIITIYHKQ